MLKVAGLGPLDEKEAMYGENVSLPSSLLRIVTVGLL
jgi:hypothetical protein